MTESSHWPPDEPIYWLTVVGRLDHLGWTVDCTTLLEHTDRHALARYSDGTNPPMWPIVDLRDGHRLGSYGTEQSAREAFAVLQRRDAEDAASDHDGGEEDQE